MKNRTIPFGYKMENGCMETDSTASEIVREIFLQYISGMSMLKIADSLNLMKIEYMPGVIGWNKGRIKRIIENNRYSGEDGYPEIISRAIFDQSQKLKSSKNNQKEIDRSKDIYKLQAPVICPHCGREMRRKSEVKRKNPQKWICQNKDCGEVIYKKDEELLYEITRLINELIDDPDVIKENEQINTADSELTKTDRYIQKCLEQQTFETSKLMQKLMDRISTAYQALNDDYYEVKLMKAELREMDKQKEFPLKLFNKYVREIHLNPDSSVSIMLINYQMI